MHDSLEPSRIDALTDLIVALTDSRDEPAAIRYEMRRLAADTLRDARKLKLTPDTVFSRGVMKKLSL